MHLPNFYLLLAQVFFLSWVLKLFKTFHVFSFNWRIIALQFYISSFKVKDLITLDNICQCSRFLNKYLFTLFLTVPNLRCCVGVFSSCSEQGPLFHAECGLLVVVSPLVAEIRPQGAGASGVVPRLSWPEACRVFLDQGLSLCPLQSKVDSFFFFFFSKVDS